MIALALAWRMLGAMVDPRGPVFTSGERVVVDAQGVRLVSPTPGRPVEPSPNREPWIWCKEPKAFAAWFRRTVRFAQAPRGVIAWLSADVRYRLWINGRLASRGPADVGRDYDSEAPGPWLDDRRDLAPYFHAGENVVAVEVFGNKLVQSEGSTGTPGFKCDIRAEGSPAFSPWRALVASAWSSSDALKFDAREEPVGWREGGYDDSTWPLATAVPSRPRTLLNELPPPMEALLPAQDVTRVEGSAQALSPSHIQATGDAKFSLRYGKVASAYVGLRVRGESGARISIRPNEADRPGHHRRFEVVLREGEQFYETPIFDSFSVINFETHGQVEIEDVRATFTSLPVRYDGAFECSDPFFNRLWTTCRWVTQICMQTHHLDSPHHQEPICDPGDYLIEALNSYAAFGQADLVRQDLRKFARVLVQRDYRNFHTSYALLWLRTLLDYYDHTGDAELVRELAPFSHGLMERFRGYVGKDGLVSEAPNYMFLDWVELEGFNLHHPPAVIGIGYMTALFAQELADDARIADLLRDADRARRDREDRRRLGEAFERELWDEGRGLYRDGKPHRNHQPIGQWLPADREIETFSTQVNTLAVACGIAPKDRARRIMDAVMSRKDMNCQPYFMHFVFDALDTAGLFEKYAPDQMRRWTILPDTQSFREMWTTGDLSHAWIATPLHQLSTRVLGIRPTAPGFDEFIVEPRPCGLDHANGVMPTRHGAIRVGWKRTGGRFTIDVDCPKGARGVVVMPSGRHESLSPGRRTFTE